MACINCGEDKPILARGWCRKCYHQLRKTEDGLRIYAVNRDKRCSVEGCKRRAHAKGVCSVHYAKTEHPLKTVWKLLRSRAGAGQYPPEWDRFERFLAEVGDRPSLKHQLRRRDVNAPWSIENSEWRAPVGVKRNAGGRSNPNYHREWSYRKFGISIAEYERMSAEQHGACAICREPKRRAHRRTGKLKSLAVDHCHKGGQVRGLLCGDCNHLLGLAKDDPEILRRAIAYLERHQEKAA